MDKIDYREKLPQNLMEKITSQYGEEIASQILKGYTAKRKTSFRVNTLKADIVEIDEVLKQNNIEYKTVNFCKDAIILENVAEKEIESLQIYKDGKIYMQSLSSMLSPIILNPQEGKDILDMAAAPGGKTTQIAALTNNNSHITACEMNTVRLERLKYNIEKQGASSVYAMQIDSRNLDDFFSFDQILLDAPCSGSGTINLQEERQVQYTEEFAQKLEKTQTALLGKAINLLKKGQEMVYSTCSILQRENEDIVNKFLKTNKLEVVPIEIEDEAVPKLPTTIPGTLCVKPNELFEGFFVAKLRKTK